MVGTITHQLLTVDGGGLPLTIARGDGDGAAVVIMPSAFGIGTDVEAQMVEVAASASAVVALDPFFRGDGGVCPYTDTARVMARLAAIDRSRAYDDLHATIRWARERSGARSVVALGVCFGGAYALMAAADGVVDGVVTWHGTRMENHVGRASEMRCPMRLHFGAADPIVPPEAVAAVRKAFVRHPDVRIIVHEGATHGFSHRSASQAYNPAAERASLASLVALVAELATPPSASSA